MTYKVISTTATELSNLWQNGNIDPKAIYEVVSNFYWRTYAVYGGGTYPKEFYTLHEATEAVREMV